MSSLVRLLGTSTSLSVQEVLALVVCVSCFTLPTAASTSAPMGRQVLTWS